MWPGSDVPGVGGVVEVLRPLLPERSVGGAVQAVVVNVPDPGTVPCGGERTDHSHCSAVVPPTTIIKCLFIKVSLPL